MCFQNVNIYVLVTPCLSPLPLSLRQKLKLEPDSGVSAKYLLASLESDPERLTRDDQVWRDSNRGPPSRMTFFRLAACVEQLLLYQFCFARLTLVLVQAVSSSTYTPW